MRAFGLGPTELAIIMLIMLVQVIPAIGVYKIASRAGHTGGISALFAVGFVTPLVSWFILLILGFAPWPRDRETAIVAQTPLQSPQPPPAV